MTAPSITIIKQKYNPAGGAERFVERALQALGREGVGLTLITRRWQTAEHMHVVRCDPFYIGSLWRDWSFARCACRQADKSQAQLIQSHERLACCDIYRAGDGVHREWLHQRQRIVSPLKRLSMRLNPYHRHVLRAEQRMFLSPRLRAIICNSHMVKDEIGRHFPPAAAKVHVVHNGVDTAHFSPRVREAREEARRRWEIDPGAVAWAFVGSGFQRKGLATALRALARHSARPYLLVAGSDKRRNDYVRLAQSLGVARQVRFTGVHDDVRPLYGAADGLLLPTLYDPFPNAVLEAMACGLPVITSTKCGAGDIIRQAQNGFIFDALDDLEIARAMERMQDPALREAVGRAARATVEGMTLDTMAGQLLDLYRILVGQQNSLQPEA